MSSPVDVGDGESVGTATDFCGPTVELPLVGCAGFGLLSLRRPDCATTVAVSNSVRSANSKWFADKLRLYSRETTYRAAAAGVVCS